jgi:hypothetical protein
MRSRARSLADKSVDAMLGAVEIYNKPNFAYREESFAILAINAWELMLKARILQLSNNKISSVLRYEKRRKANGELSEKLYRVKNRSGSFLSVGLFGAIDRLRDEYGDKVHPSVRENLELICEVRDNAVHFFNKGFDISRLVQELGTACLRNYLVLLRQWFAIDMSGYNFFLMPLAFVRDEMQVQAVSLNADERKLISYLKSRAAEDKSDATSDFSISLRLDLKFSKSKDSDAPKVKLSNDPDATPVTLSEEDIREKYPWDYSILTTRLQKRFNDFRQNQQYHDIRKPLEADERFCRERYLDPGNPKSTVKRFYSPNIVKEFDGHYKKKT